jgi:hypothetical protein
MKREGTKVEEIRQALEGIVEGRRNGAGNELPQSDEPGLTVNISGDQSGTLNIDRSITINILPTFNIVDSDGKKKTEAIQLWNSRRRGSDGTLGTA